MLNINSPTVQQMLKNTPQGFGNMPTYSGNGPTITSETIAVPRSELNAQQQNQQMPFPSPKEMLAMQGQNNIYNPAYFGSNNYYQPQMQPVYNYGYQDIYQQPQPMMPNNYYSQYQVTSNNYMTNGIYNNPNISREFNNYYNPYMGQGTYYGNQSYPYQQQQQYYYPTDQETLDTIEIAANNGLSYYEQLKEESSLFKHLSRITSKNLERSEEDAKACEEYFTIYDRTPKQEDMIVYQAIPALSISVKCGDEVLYENIEKPKPMLDPYRIDNDVRYIDNIKQLSAMKKINLANKLNQLYIQAPERMIDNMDLASFFNTGAGVLMADNLNRQLYYQSLQQVKNSYDQKMFRNRLFKNNGLRGKEEIGAVERFTGRYGIMPDGRPVSPGHDPAIATCFSYDPKTGQYSVTAPNFISDKVDRARSAFLSSLEKQ